MGGDDVDVEVVLPEDVEVDVGDVKHLPVDYVEVLDDDVDVEDVDVEACWLATWSLKKLR